MTDVVSPLVCSFLSCCTSHPAVKAECNKICNVDNNFQLLRTKLVEAEKLLEKMDFSKDIEVLQDNRKRLQRLCYEVEDVLQDNRKRLQRLCYEVEDVINDSNRVIKTHDRHSQCRNPLGKPSSLICNPKLPRRIAKKLKQLMNEIKNGEPHKKELGSDTSLEGAALKCLYYFSLFPEPHQFDKEELILLWIGAGLLEAPHTNASSFLDIGWNCFNKLLEKSVLKPLSGDEDLNHQMYTITTKLAQIDAPKIYLRLSRNSQTDDLRNRDLCHLSLTLTKEPTTLQEDIKLRKCLRTFIFICGHLGNIQPDLFSKMICLRVLVLKNTDIKELPYIAHLKRLRLLDISETRVGSLPRELCALPYLQILKFKKSTRHTPRQAVQLPDNFSKMTDLVYVDWDVNCIRTLQTQPDNIGSLINLETLPLFVVTEKKGHRITELEKMNRLRNSLCITNLEAVPNENEAKQACIDEKSGLRSLKLQWITFPEKEIAESVLRGLQPHNNLEELHVVNYHSNSYPTWFHDPSFRLQKIHLENCSSCNLLQSFGHLKVLEVLHLEGMHKLKSMDDLFDRIHEYTSQYFTSLKSLILNNIEELEHWKELRENQMPQLENLVIKGCQRLKTLPPLENLTSLKHIKIDGCKELLSSLQSLIINYSKLQQVQGQDRLKLGDLPKIEIDGEPIELPTTLSSEPKRSPSKETSGNPLTDFLERVKRRGGIVIRESGAQRSNNVSKTSGTDGKGKDKVIYPDPQGDSSSSTFVHIGESSVNSEVDHAMPSSTSTIVHCGESSVKFEVAPALPHSNSTIDQSIGESTEILASNSENGINEICTSHLDTSGSETSHLNQHCNEHVSCESCGLGDSIPEKKRANKSNEEYHADATSLKRTEN